MLRNATHPSLSFPYTAFCHRGPGGIMTGTVDDPKMCSKILTLGVEEKNNLKHIHQHQRNWRNEPSSAPLPMLFM